MEHQDDEDAGPLTHHAGVQVLVHTAERVWRHLSFARQQQCDVGDSQRVEALGVQSPAVCQKYAVRPWTAAGAQAGRAAVWRGLDDVPALLQSLFTLIQDPAGTVHMSDCETKMANMRASQR